jgi:hypothetical protein
VNETTIRCAGCGFAGKSADGFRSEGHDPLRGCLYYRCPSCARLLFVDPMEAPSPCPGCGAYRPASA